MDVFYVSDEDIKSASKIIVDSIKKYNREHNIKQSINGYNRPKREEFDSYYEYLEHLVGHLECRRKVLELLMHPTESMIMELSQEIYQRNKIKYDRMENNSFDGDKSYVDWPYFDALLEIDSRIPEYEQEIKRIDEELNYKKKILINNQKVMSIATIVKR